jgi:hypothetical protein
VIETIMPEHAIDYLHALPWYLYGGSYWGGAGRASGRRHWDL